MSVDRAWFEAQASEYARSAAGSSFPLDAGAPVFPCDDRHPGAGFDRHYAPMDLWAAEKIIPDRREAVGKRHVDVGSRVDGFCTHLLAAGLHVVHVDVRDPLFRWPGFEFRQDDARTLATFEDGSVSSLSCLHVAEHVGLGRYGDEIDPQGMEKTMASLARVLAPGGRLYFAVPMGRHRVVFNAHRVAHPGWVHGTFAGLGLVAESFAAVDDAGVWHPEADPVAFVDANYACGCFEFSRRSS